MFVRFVKDDGINRSDKIIQDPTACPFCNVSMDQTFPGDQCLCGALVTAIYGDKPLPLRNNS